MSWVVVSLAGFQVTISGRFWVTPEALTRLETRLVDKFIPDNPAGLRRATLSCYLTKIARLGGYLARTKDPPPGNTVMWRGLSRLTDIQLGFLMGAQLVGN